MTKYDLSDSYKILIDVVEAGTATILQAAVSYICGRCFRDRFSIIVASTSLTIYITAPQPINSEVILYN